MHHFGKTCRRYLSFLVQISGIVPRPKNETLDDYLQIASNGMRLVGR